MNHIDLARIEFKELKQINDEEYFASEGLSNSRLKDINAHEGGSIEKFTKEICVEKTSQALSFGKIVHELLLLKKDNFVCLDNVKLSDKLKLIAEHVVANIQDPENINNESLMLQLTKESCFANDYYASKLTDNIVTKTWITIKDFVKELLSGKTIVNKEELELLDKIKEFDMTKEFQCHSPELMFTETTIYSNLLINNEDEDKSVLLKGKIDYFHIDHELKKIVICDIKTDIQPASAFFESWEIKINHQHQVAETSKLGVFYQYHYYRQLAFYQTLVNSFANVIGAERYEVDCHILHVNKNTGKVTNFKITENQINLGLIETEKILSRLSFLRLI